MSIRTGKCLCGAVQYTAKPQTTDVGVCHCSMCRKFSSGPMMGLRVEPPDFADDGTVGTYASSDWGERGFCTRCGSTLFWRSHDKAAYVISAGTLDDTSGLKLASEIFIDDKPDFYEFDAETHQLTGAQVMQQFMENSGDDPG